MLKSKTEKNTINLSVPKRNFEKRVVNVAKMLKNST